MDAHDNQITNPSIPPGLGATGWWLYKTADGVHHASPMKNSNLKGPWKAGMTWSYEPAEVRAWLSMKKKHSG